MKALVVTQNGRMELQESPLPALLPGQVRVHLQFAGVGFADLMAVQGGYFLAPPKPFSPGYEFMGTVAEVGSEVIDLHVGQRVAGMLPHMAAYCDTLDVEAHWAVPVPEALSSEAAAAMPLNYLTASLLLGPLSRLSVGDPFVIHGAAGGVGTAVLELARSRGFRAFGVVSAGKEAVVEALGATPMTRGTRWLDHAREQVPEGFRAAFDSFGGYLLRQSYASLGNGGTLVSYGFSSTSAGGNGPLIDGLVFHTLKGLFPTQKRKMALCRAPMAIENDPVWYRTTLTGLFSEAAAGRLVPRLHGVLPWTEAAQAHQILAAGAVKGKLLLGVA